MAIGPSFYNQADQDLYAGGLQFLPQEQYRLSLGNNNQVNRLDFSNLSNSGIISQAPAPIIYPLINQGGGGGGSNINNIGNLGNYKNIDFDERYTFNPQEFMSDANDYGYGVADQDKGFFKQTINKIGNTLRGSPVDKALGKTMNLGKTIGGGIISAATGIPFLGSALGYMTKNMENRPLGAGIIDEQGNFFDEDELNSQNALGGYYTDAARSSRRRTARIAKMIARQQAGKKISTKNLYQLQEQEKAQEAARQAAANQMQQENRATGRGGYQAAESSPGAGDGYSGDFMDGGGRGTGMGAADKGGSDSMGSFATGGRVGYFYGGLASIL